MGVVAAVTVDMGVAAVAVGMDIVGVDIVGAVVTGGRSRTVRRRGETALTHITMELV
jgi:hypothetical protein